VDRTREILTGTDAAVVRFRSLMLKGAGELMEGKEPEAPYLHQAFRARPGSWLTDPDKPLEQVMQERFQDPLGRVHKDVPRAAE
jgi:hypothetical protein